MVNGRIPRTMRALGLLLVFVSPPFFVKEAGAQAQANSLQPPSFERSLMDARHGALEKELHCRALVEAASRGSLEDMVDVLIRGVVDVNTRCYGTMTALMAASFHGHKSAAEFLLALEAEVDAKDGYGATPLMMASEQGHPKVVKVLLDNKAEVGVREKLSQRTPVIYAARNGYYAVIELLLSRDETGTHANATDKFSNTALIYSSFYGHLDAVEALLSNGAAKAVNHKGMDGKTALAFAQEKGFEDIVHLLLKYGAEE